MIVVMSPAATEGQIQAVIEDLSVHGFDVHRSSGLRHTVLGAIGTKPEFDHREIGVLPGVDVVYRVTPDASQSGTPTAPFGRETMGGGRTVVLASLRDPAGPDEIADLLSSRPRVSGVVWETGRVVDPVKVREAADAAHAGGAGFLLAPAGQVGRGFDGVDGLVLPSVQSNQPDLIDPIASVCPLLVLRAPRSPQRWVASVDRVRSRGTAVVLLLASPFYRAGVSVADVDFGRNHLGVPVLLDASRRRQAWSPSIHAGIAVGAAGVVVRGEATAWESRERAIGLAELAAVASAVGRPVRTG